MIFHTDANYYEILEIRPDASAQDIRNAYLRLKASYRKDNPALYSVLDPADTEDMISKIEEAFQMLSDPDSRREYDERHGFSERIERKILSLDRSPVQERRTNTVEFGAGEDDLLNPPSTEFAGMDAKGENGFGGTTSFSLPTQTPSPFDRTPIPSSAPARAAESSFVERRTNPPDRRATPDHRTDPVAAEIANETEWKGSTIRKIREMRRYSLDDIAQITKISKTYVIAIEEETYNKLPAPVFIRGFLLQIAKTLKIPTEPVAQAYMLRYQKRVGGN